MQYVAQSGLGPAILLPQPRRCWGFSCVDLHSLISLVFTKLERQAVMYQIARDVFGLHF